MVSGYIYFRRGGGLITGFRYKSKRERDQWIAYWKEKFQHEFFVYIKPDIEWREIVEVVPLKKQDRPKAEYTNIDSKGYGIAKELHSK